MSPSCHGSIHIAFHQAKVFQPLSQNLAYFQMHILVRHSRTGNLHRLVVTSQYNIIYIFLTLIETSAHRNRTGKIGTIIHIILRPGIRQHHTSHGQCLAMIVIMQRLAILGKDHGERNQTSVRGGNSLDQPGNILLFLSRQCVFHSSHVHLVTNITSQVNLLDFASLLHGTQCHHGLDQFQRRIILNQRVMNTQQILQQ